jgi:hypothetical protein
VKPLTRIYEINIKNPISSRSLPGPEPVSPAIGSTNRGPGSIPMKTEKKEILGFPAKTVLPLYGVAAHYLKRG